MKNNEIVAGIVLFNPDNVERLYENVNSLYKQVSKLYIFDNSTLDLNLKFPENTVYLRENQNKGIAYALNMIMSCAEKDGFNWVLTMDQDSVLPDGMVQSFADFIQKSDETRLGILCPQVIDKRRAYMKVELKVEDHESIDFCITSASCTSTQAWKTIGGFDEWLFIDLVDNEFCKRLIAADYKIVRMNKWVLDQEFGQITPKSKKKQAFWIKMSRVFHNANIAKLSYTKVVSPMRVYYTCRNIIYVNRKLRLYGKTGYENYNCKGYVGFLISFVAPSILRSNNKAKVIDACIRGTKDGLSEDVIEWKI